MLIRIMNITHILNLLNLVLIFITMIKVINFHHIWKWRFVFLRLIFISTIKGILSSKNVFTYVIEWGLFTDIVCFAYSSNMEKKGKLKNSYDPKTPNRSLSYNPKFRVAPFLGTKKYGVAPFLGTQKYGVAPFLRTQKRGVALFW